MIIIKWFSINVLKRCPICYSKLKKRIVKSEYKAASQKVNGCSWSQDYLYDITIINCHINKDHYYYNSEDHIYR